MTASALLQLPQAAHDLLGITLNEEQQRAFEAYSAALIDWNTRVNLTAITDPLAVEIRHFLDSLSVLKAFTSPLSETIRLIDVGTGAGFPGLPLRILLPTLHLTLLEATGKKTAFLQHVVDTLHLDHVEVVNLRAEEAGQLPQYRGHFDVVAARAVARLPVLAEYLLPLCKIGGRCIALKGESAAAEVQASRHAIRLLGGRFGSLIKVELPTVNEPHYLIVIEKVAATPPSYPRRPGLPAKAPL